MPEWLDVSPPAVGPPRGERPWWPIDIRADRRYFRYLVPKKTTVLFSLAVTLCIAAAAVSRGGAAATPAEAQTLGSLKLAMQPAGVVGGDPPTGGRAAAAPATVQFLPRPLSRRPGMQRSFTSMARTC